MHVAIGGPTRETVPASFALDLAQLFAYTREKGPWSKVTLGFVGATYVHVGRERVLEEFVRIGATHLLWLDTDMSFPPEAAVRLVQHGRPFVACNYVMRDQRRLFTARRGSVRVATDEASTGLEAVDEVGLGCALMETSIVRNLPRPWFMHGRNAQGGDIGEDVMFCRAVTAFGAVIYVDHDLSKEIGHIGQHTYRTVNDLVTV